ncbi:MAG: hypothetical protein QOE43_616 [Gaiellaceae bacterium]|jgi:streptogramin lyase|nr:hypothetical protein [Gaiellaceae bacterium]
MKPAGTAKIVAAVCAVLAIVALTGADAVARTQGRSAPRLAPTSISVSGFPAIVATGYGSVWVGGHRNGVLYRIDPKTNRITGKVALPGPINGTLTIGAGAVWAQSAAPDGSESYVYRINPFTMRIVERHEGITSVLGAGSWWFGTLQPPSLLRVKPNAGTVMARITKFGVDPNRVNIPIAFGRGSIWVYSPDDAVIRISVATNRATAVIPLPGAKRANAITHGYLMGGPAAIVGGYVWVVSPAGLYRIDPQSNAAELLSLRVTPFSQWGLPSVSSGPRGTLFVRTSDRVVTQIDPSSGAALRTYPASGGGGETAVGFGSLWIANALANSISRIALQ